MVEIKQVIVARTDLKMGKGKLAAQVAHASLAAVEEDMGRRGSWFQEWKEQGQAKVVLKGASDAELQELFRKARAMGLPSSLIQDAGSTQLEPGTVTCLGIGPAPADLIDRVTGHLKLL
ncbi:MAG: peptidyl-tRNA hydrolase Pth2 [Nitrososphaerales archaeon]|jgi:PTH2 family peptidyl-tRNA hydrolase